MDFNKSAMDSLKRDDLSTALKHLQQAESLLSSTSSPIDANLWAITFNNFGCYYKKTGKFALALQCLQKALKHPPSTPTEQANIAGTYLNICSICSQLGTHEAAAEYALKAVSLLEGLNSSANTATTLVIALHNLAVEYEFLSRIPESLKFYKKALGLAQVQLGPHHQITLTLKNSYAALADTQNYVRSRHSTKSNRRTQSTSPNQGPLPRLVTAFKRTNPIPRSNDYSAPKPRPLQRYSLKTAPFQVQQRTKQSKTRRPLTYHIHPINTQDKAEIEQKLATLQTQLVNFEKKYELLEQKHNAFVTQKADQVNSPFNYPARNKNTIEAAARTIQRYWRGWVGRSIGQRQRVHKRMKDALNELDLLKKQVAEETSWKAPDISSAKIVSN